MGTKGQELIKRLTKREEFTLKGGQIVYLRKLSGTLGLELATKYRDAGPEASADEMDAARIVADTLLDDEGNLIFDDPKEVLALPFDALIEIAQEAQRISGLVKEKGEEDSLPKE